MLTLLNKSFFMKPIKTIHLVKMFFMFIGVATAIASLSRCTQRAALGSESNPIKLFFTPSVDAKVIEDVSKVFESFLEKNTKYKFNVSSPQSYVAVVEAFGTKKADVAAINTFGYILANEKYGVEARLCVIRHGTSTYRSQFITKSNSKIHKIEDLKGKKIAFVDPASTSGYLLPLKTLREKKIEPKETVFAMKHDSVVSMIYQGQVDAGATFYSPPVDGKIEDARRLVLTQYPDVEKKIKIIELSESIPNDPIVFRKDMPEEMKLKIIEAFILFVSTPEGKDAFKKIYSVTDLKKCTDTDYESVRQMLRSLNKKADELM